MLSTLAKNISKTSPHIYKYVAIKRMAQSNYSFKRAKALFKQESIDNNKLPKHIRGWLKSEYRRTGDFKKVRNPPGMDVGHLYQNLHHPQNFRWEFAYCNRSRGSKWERNSDIRTLERFLSKFEKE